jgi:hypothetical protein
MKRMIRMVLIFCILIVGTTTVNAEPSKQIHQVLSETASYLMAHNPNPSMGSIGGEWMIMGLARGEKLRSQYGITYRKNLAQTVKDCQGNLSERKYTEYARVVIALTSIKENPEKFQGYNLLKPLAELDGVKKQGSNGIIYTLIALDCGGYQVPSADKEYGGEVTTREKLIQLLLNGELEDGGWAFSGKKADADITAMAIQALAPYYRKDAAVKKAVNRGLEVLSEIQLSDGSYETTGIKTCESTAQVLMALSELGISVKDQRFVKNGNTVLDGLLQYYKNGGFLHTKGGSINGMATEQAFYALVAYSRSTQGKNRLYNMSDAVPIREPEISYNRNSSEESQTTKASTGKKKQKVPSAKERETGVTETVSVKGKETTSKKGTKKEEKTEEDSKVAKAIARESTSMMKEQQDTTKSEKETGNETGNEKEESSGEKRLYLVLIPGAAVLFGGVYCWKRKRKVI